MKDFDDYTVANISKEDVESISKLEKVIGEKLNEDIVLIAYQPSKNGTKVQ